MSDYIADLKDGSGNGIRPQTVWEAILNAPDFAGEIQAAKDIANGKIDKGQALAYWGNDVNGDTDWDTVVKNGIHMVNATGGNRAGTHFPGRNNQASTTGAWGVLLVMGNFGKNADGGLGVQVAFMVPGDIYIRSHDGGGTGFWEDWRRCTFTVTP